MTNDLCVCVISANICTASQEMHPLADSSLAICAVGSPVVKFMRVIQLKPTFACRTWTHQFETKITARRATDTNLSLVCSKKQTFPSYEWPGNLLQYLVVSTVLCSTLIQVICRCGRQCAPCSVLLVSDSSPGHAIILTLSLSPAVSLFNHTVVTRDTHNISRP